MTVPVNKVVKCRLCDSEKTKFLFSKQTFLKYDDKVWDIYECLNCSLKFIHKDQYPNFDYEKFYNFRYKNRNINYFTLKVKDALSNNEWHKKKLELVTLEENFDKIMKVYQELGSLRRGQ